MRRGSHGSQGYGWDVDRVVRWGGPGEGERRKGRMPRPPPPPGPPRSRSCSGPPAAPPGSARQAPPARRRRGGGVDAVAYAFARERVQEGPGGRHLAVVPRGARGVAQAGHGAGGALGAAAVSAKTGRAAPPGLCFSHPSDPAAPSPPPERRPLTFGNPSRSPEPVDRQTADTRLRRAGAGKSAPLRPGFWSAGFPTCWARSGEICLHGWDPVWAPRSQVKQEARSGV